MGLTAAFGAFGNHIKKVLTPCAHSVLDSLSRENKQFNQDLELARIYVFHNMNSTSANFDSATHYIAETANKRVPDHASHNTVQRAVLEVVDEINQHGYRLPAYLRPEFN